LNPKTNQQIRWETWNAWQDFWVYEKQSQIPPLHYLKLAPNRFGGIFVTDVARRDLLDFISYLSSCRNLDLYGYAMGDWALDPTQWFGHWKVFQVR